MFSYRSSPLANLAAQLKRGPIRLRLRQLAGIDFVLSVIEPSKSYPLDFVCHALTGFRPRAGAKNGDSQDAMLVDGELLRDDLVTLAEDLSASAELLAEG